MGSGQGEKFLLHGWNLSSCQRGCSSLGPCLVQSYIHPTSSSTFVLPNINIYILIFIYLESQCSVHLSCGIYFILQLWLSPTSFIDGECNSEHSRGVVPPFFDPPEQVGLLIHS